MPDEPRDQLVVRPASAALAPRGELPSAFEQAARQVIAGKGSLRTRAAYALDLKGWLSFCATLRVAPEQASLVESTSYRDRLLAAGKTSSSVHRACAALSSIYATLLEGRIVAGNPFAPRVLSWPSADALHPTPAVEEEAARAILANCIGDPSPAGARDGAIISLLYTTGMRRMSVAGLLREQVRGGPVRFELQAVVKGGRQSAPKPITGDAAERLERWLQQRDRNEAWKTSRHLFPGENPEKPINVTTITRIVANRAALAGVKTPVSPHQFRAAWITKAYDLELPEYEIQAAADHVRVETTRRYDRHKRGARAIERVAAEREKEK